LTLIFNPEKDGLYKVFRHYQVEAMRVVWKRGDDGAISREVWSDVNEKLGSRKISRASIINFLNAMVDEAVLGYEEETGKGGYHRVYRPKLNEEEFKRYLAEKMISSLLKDFPAKTREALGEYK
jgi:predicted transcriptional regulator